MTTKQLFRQSDNNRIKSLVKDLPKHTDRVYMLVHADVFKGTINQSKTILN
jgi:hypothetical protein